MVELLDVKPGVPVSQNRQQQ